MDIFNAFGSILGYILWAFYFVVRNYGVAILLFTILVKLVLFPLSVKQQRSMAASGKIAEKQKVLAERYKNDKAKYQEELQKLYAQEGASPGGGCLVTLIPFPIMIGLYYTVINPLSNALHIASSSVTKATELLMQIPGVSSTISTRYVEMEIINHFSELRHHLSSVWSEQELKSVGEFADSFNFLGLNLLNTPSQSSFGSMMWIIPALCLIFSIGTQVYMMFTNDSMKNQMGCVKVTMLLLPLITVFLAWSLPGAIGFYWICNSMTMFAQTVIMNHFYSREHLTAHREARRIARRIEEEPHIPEIPVAHRRTFKDPGTNNAQKGGNTNNKKKK